MTWIIDTKSKRRLSAKLAAGLVISAILALGTFAGSASAQWRGGNRGGYHHWNGGYYPAPPVVYGSRYGSSYYGYDDDPYQYPPPVVYGPGIGINLPGIGIRIGR
jgi:hypothetical protein